MVLKLCQNTPKNHSIYRNICFFIFITLFFCFYCVWEQLYHGDYKKFYELINYFKYSEKVVDL